MTELPHNNQQLIICKSPESNFTLYFSFNSSKELGKCGNCLLRAINISHKAGQIGWKIVDPTYCETIEKSKI